MREFQLKLEPKLFAQLSETRSISRYFDKCPGFAFCFTLTNDLKASPLSFINMLLGKTPDTQNDIPTFAVILHPSREA